MLRKGARVALPFIVIGSPGQVSSKDFARGALSKPTTMIDTHVRAIWYTRVWVNNSRVHHFSPKAIEVALCQNFQFGLFHIVVVQVIQFLNAVILDISAYIDRQVFVTLQKTIVCTENNLQIR